jgi:signal transduction histidine kinase
VDEFSMLARFPTAEPQPTDINRVIYDAIAMFNGRMDGIELRTSLSGSLPPVMADAHAMKRVFANLIDNAAEAMQDSLVKEIEIRSITVESDPELVEVSISDTGHGITPELKERLFLPYFSTKERGTGLGLAIVSRIVEEHRGTIRVEENKPIGARFIVELPVQHA